MYASELKDTLTRLRPDFDERAYGCATFGKLMALVAGHSARLKVWTEESSLKIGLNGSDAPTPQLNKENWINAFREYLNQYKRSLDRIPVDLKGRHPGGLTRLRRKAIGSSASATS